MLPVAIPQLIKIRREKGYHTDQIGKYGDGNQFMGFVTATLPLPLPEDWPTHKRWYAVLHTFDQAGQHLKSDIWFAGTSACGERESIERATLKLAAMLTGLGKVKYGNVKIALFHVEFDGHTFGLVDDSEPDEDFERVTLYPNDLAFFAPWNGSYDT